MTTAEDSRHLAVGSDPDAAGFRTGARGSRGWVWGGLAVVLAGGLGLRLWGIDQGLPFAYNADESDHFVPRAVAMFGHDLNPHYFANPPAFTYLLHYLFAAWYGGTAAVQHVLHHAPGEPYTLGRALAAVLGTAALWLLYAAGSKLLGRAAALLAAAIEAVAFLPVFYAHLALNDVPTLAPLTLSLLGTAGVLRSGRARDHALAGVGLGLACATKYTAGIALAPYVAAVVAHHVQARRQEAAHAPLRHTLAGVALAGASALAAFLVANPYAILDYRDFHHELVHQSSLSAEGQGKLGAPREGGIAYYLWTLTWGFGWIPTVAALGGAVSVWRSERALGWVLVPAPLLYLAFMGLQGRYFGRWLLPIFPLLCLLAALFAVQMIGAVARRAPGLRVAFAALLVLALLAQGLIYSVHSGLVLSRTDTRNATRAWMLGHVPAGAKIVLEPLAPGAWVREGAGGVGGDRWRKYLSLTSRISSDGALQAQPTGVVGIEDYVLTLSPALIGYYEDHGYCWVVSGSTESGRAFAAPAEAPHAIAYYRALQRRGEVVYRASPYVHGGGPVAFGFDWSFDYYPLAYDRPGPEMTVYRLHGGRCP